MSFVGERRRSEPGPIDSDVDHVSPEVVTGRVEVLSLSSNYRSVDVGDNQTLFIGDRLDDPTAVRGSDRRATVI